MKQEELATALALERQMYQALSETASLTVDLSEAVSRSGFGVGPAVSPDAAGADRPSGGARRRAPPPLRRFDAGAGLPSYAGTAGGQGPGDHAGGGAPLPAGRPEFGCPGKGSPGGCVCQPEAVQTGFLLRGLSRTSETQRERRLPFLMEWQSALSSVWRVQRGMEMLQSGEPLWVLGESSSNKSWGSQATRLRSRPLGSATRT